MQSCVAGITIAKIQIHTGTYVTTSTTSGLALEDVLKQVMASGHGVAGQQICQVHAIFNLVELFRMAVESACLHLKASLIRSLRSAVLQSMTMVLSAPVTKYLTATHQLMANRQIG